MKTIEEAFREWNSEVLQGDLNEEAVRLVRDAFYAGVMASLERACAKPVITRRTFHEFIVETTEELAEYASEMGDEIAAWDERN